MLVQEHEQVADAVDSVPGPRSAHSSTPRDLALLRSAGPEPGINHARVAELVARDRGPDLEVRLHGPIPQVVIMRVAGTVDRYTVALLAQRVGQQLARAAHVVLDLGEVTVLDADGVAVLLDLHREAGAGGKTLYIAGVDHEAISHPLRLNGADQRLTLAPSADAVIALLHRDRLTAQPDGTP